jgi:uncharacterized Tic20 family protein
MSAAEELDKLKKLHDDRTITDEQYERARAKLLDKEHDERDDERADEERRPRGRRDHRDDEKMSPAKEEQETRQWSMFLHLSLVVGHAVAMGWIIGPILIWQIKKNELPRIDEHGRNAVNWLISYILYLVISGVLCFVAIGFVLLPIVLVLNIVFPIIAAVKANEGRVWKYPLAISFFK